MKRGPKDITDLNVQQLRSFATVFEQSSYAGAAREIGLSVPTIWEQVQSLEAIYGTALFRKSGRRIMPTDAARRLYTSLGPILAGLESTFELVGDEAQVRDGRITVVTGVRMMLEDLARPLASFRHQYPHIRLMIRQGNDEMAEELIISGEADVAFGLEPGSGQASERLEYQPVYSIDFLAIAPPDHPLVAKPRVTIRQLSEHDLVVGGPGTYVRRTLEEAFHRENLQGRITVETDTSAFTIACVQAGMGVGVLAGDADGTLCANLTVRSLRRQLGKRRIMVLTRRGRQLPAPIRALIQLVRASRGSR